MTAAAIHRWDRFEIFHDDLDMPMWSGKYVDNDDFSRPVDVEKASIYQLHTGGRTTVFSAHLNPAIGFCPYKEKEDLRFWFALRSVTSSDQYVGDIFAERSASTNRYPYKYTAKSINDGLDDNVDERDEYVIKLRKLLNKPKVRVRIVN